MKRYPCPKCRYVYDRAEGDEGAGVRPGTDLPEVDPRWKCPVCGAGRDLFLGPDPKAAVVRRYSGDDLTVVWQPGLCNHNGNCTRRLPGVFDIDRRPWVDLTRATTEEIREVIDECPTGALSYEDAGN